jgi:vitamin B12 transporter
MARGGGKRYRRAVLAAACGLALGGGGAALAEEAVRTDPVVVTATRIPERVSGQASDVSVVTREESKILLPVAAGDVMQGLPGVDVQRSGVAGDRENIKIRGGRSAYTLVQVDGYPVNSPSTGQFDIGFLPIDLFERTEVVRGAQSALYGSNAMSGVVNFIPRKGERTGFGASLSGGSYDTWKWGAFGQGRWPSGGLFAGAGGYRSDGILPNDDASILSFLGSGDGALGDRVRLGGMYFAADGEKGIAVDDAPRDANHRMKRRIDVGGARLSAALTRALSLSASASVAAETLEDNDPADPGETAEFDFTDRSRKNAYGLEARYVPSPESTTILGAGYDRDESDSLSAFSDTGFSSTDRRDVATYNRSIYLQEELRLSRKAGVSLGARLDRNTEAGTQFNPKAAAFLTVGRWETRLRAAAGRGFRVPTPVEKFNTFNGFAGLAPEVAWSYEAGVDQPLAGNNVRLSATWFYQEFTDLIQPDPSVTGGPFGLPQLRNVGHSFARGVEAEAAVRVAETVTALVTYTYNDTWDGSAGTPLLGIPKVQGMLSGLCEPVPAIQVRVDWRYVGEQWDLAPFAFSPATRPAYARLDSYARYVWNSPWGPLREMAFTGRVQNVLNRHYEERLGVPSPGINFLLGVEAGI